MHPYHPDNWPPAEYREPQGSPIQFRPGRAQPQPARVIPNRSTAGGQGRQAAPAGSPRPATTPGPIAPAAVNRGAATAWRAGTLTARLEYQTDRAYLVIIELAGTVRKIWLPKSKCRQIGETRWTVPRWLAQLKELTT